MEYFTPVMGIDPSGHSPEWWHWVLSGVLVVGGLALTIATAGIASGGLVGTLATVGGILGGSMMSAGAGAMLNGYINEINGGSFTAGYWGGMVSGAIAGASAGIGGSLLSFASTLRNVPMLLALGGGLATSFGGGFAGSYFGSKLIYSMDGIQYDKKSLLISSYVSGAFNLGAGLLSGLTGCVGETLNSASSTNTIVATKMAVGALSTGGEIMNDLLALLIGVLL